MKVLAVIPSRFAAVRYPGKPLAVILDKPMVQWVYEAAAAARLVDEVTVATDDERIAAVVKAFGGKARMTRSDHANGTERIAEAAAASNADIVVNVQGDEPAMDARAI
ncbi:MAG: NTP transferase domain-containing protein, partial [Candidatus Methylomirabilis sp.]|nr:NTP transferase domain-containing protein [Deltaproteobacteria bacterium]